VIAVTTLLLHDCGTTGAVDLWRSKVAGYSEIAPRQLKQIDISAYRSAINRTIFANNLRLEVYKPTKMAVCKENSLTA